MNKQERKLKMLAKQKRRIDILQPQVSGDLSPKYKQRLKTMSTPCSCTICSPRKVTKTTLKLKVRLSHELQEARCEAYEYLM
jgi:Flp pilus assembly CpaF family ATPase